MKDRKFRNCIGCKYLVSQVRETGGNQYIGYCSAYCNFVVDTLCGCEIENGKVVLKNFNGTGRKRGII